MNGRRTLLLAELCCFAACLQPLYGQTARTPSISFATPDEERAVLTAHDDFVQSLSPFDRSARLKTDKDVSESEYLAFVGHNVIAWTPNDESRVEEAYARIKPELERMNLPFPATVRFIKTTGQEEGDAAYTRANAIVLPPSFLSKASAELAEVIAHELFHVLSRNSPDLRDRAYAAIGFYPCGPIVLSPYLASRKLTNPDAPANDHCISISAMGKTAWAVPLLLSSGPYDVSRGGEFFDYIKLEFLIVADKSGAYDSASPLLVNTRQLSGFYEQVGRNTDYIIHPEEILADNFALLATGKTAVASPDVLRKIASALH